MRPPNGISDERGQGSLEYVGLIALVAAALAALAVLVTRPAHLMLSVVERAICAGLGHGCEIGGEESLALEPCPVTRSTTEADAHATVMSVRAGGGRTAMVELRSDGSVVVTIADRGELGVEGGAGASFTTGVGISGARVEAGAGVEVGAGRGYEFADLDAALEFLEEERESLVRRAASVAMPGCGVCSLFGGGTEEEREPDFTYLEGGGVARAGADAGAGVASGEARADGTGAIGRRVDNRTGEITYYFRAEGGVTGGLGAGVAVSGGAGAETAIEYTTSSEGRPLDLSFRSTAGTRSGTGPAVRQGGASGTGAPAAAARGGSGRGRVVEQIASLDLSDQRSREVAMRFIETLGPPADPASLPGHTRALKRRLDRAGLYEERVFSTTEDDAEVAGDAALGPKLGAGFAGRESKRTLTGAYTRPEGATLFLERTDCLG